MKIRTFYGNFFLVGLCVLCAGALLCPRAQAQLWDRLTKPQITVNLTHPPGLGLNIKKVAFGPANGRCSDEILGRLAGALIPAGVNVMDWQNLQALLARQHLSLGGSLDHQAAVRMGKLLGPTALIFVRVSGCRAEQRRDFSDNKNHKGEVVRTNRAIVEVHLRGSLQTIDLATGRIFSATPIAEDSVLINKSKEGQPDFPSENAVRDDAIQRAATDASTMFINWTEQKQLYFFNDKDCNLNLAFALLKANDFDGTIRQSEENIVACKTWPKVKDSNMAHAYYNAGLAYLLVNEHEKAMAYLTQAQALKGGDIVTETITQAENSAKLEAEMRRVADRTEKFEQSQADATAAAPPPTAASPDSPEEHLKKLDSLFKKGLISRQDYEAKKAQILKDL